MVRIGPSNCIHGDWVDLPAIYWPQQSSMSIDVNARASFDRCDGVQQLWRQPMDFVR